MLSEIQYRGGSVAQTMNGTESLYLTDETRWVYVIGSGTTGTAKIYLPYARGLINGMTFHIMTGTGSTTSVDFQILRSDLTAIDHYGKDGSAAQTLIDMSDSTKWGSLPAVKVTLLDHTANSGSGDWRCYFWGED